MIKTDPRLQRAIILLCGTLTLGGCYSTPAVINTDDSLTDALPEDTGIGGSGIQLADERGIGGSGKQSEETGIGGSGIRLADERGIGGSGRQQTPATEHWLTQLQPGETLGVVGTVNDFGSIWVNGLHIHVDERTRILEDGKPATPDQINLGQRAVIQAGWQQGELRASTIELVHEVIGPVSQRDLQQRQLTILGQTIQLTDNQPLPEAGSWVAISGQRTTTQQINASRIDTVTDQQTILLRGTLARTDNQLSISQLPLAAIATPFEHGSFVTLQARMINNTLQNVKLERPQRLTQQPGLRLLSIERSSTALSVAGPYSPRLQVLPATKPHQDSAPSQVLEIHIQPGQPPKVEQIFTKPATNWQQPDKVSSGHPEQTPAGITPPPPPPEQPGTLRPEPATMAAPPPPTRPPQPSAHQRPAPQHLSLERPQAAIRPEPPQRPDTVARPERPQRPDVVARPERPVRPEIIARPEIISRPERPTRPDTVARPERPDHSQRPPRPPRPPR